MNAQGPAHPRRRALGGGASDVALASRTFFLSSRSSSDTGSVILFNSNSTDAISCCLLVKLRFSHIFLLKTEHKNSKLSMEEKSGGITYNPWSCPHSLQSLHYYYCSVLTRKLPLHGLFLIQTQGPSFTKDSLWKRIILMQNHTILPFFSDMHSLHSGEWIAELKQMARCCQDSCSCSVSYSLSNT